MFFDKRSWVVLCAVWAVCSARGWSWPEGAESVRIDTKVRFLDDRDQPASQRALLSTVHIDKRERDEAQSDEIPFREPSDTEGFYNRPPGAGRYPVRVEGNAQPAYQVNIQGVYPVHSNKRNDGTLDSIPHCKCVSTPECNPRPNSAEVCGSGKFLCCSKRPNNLKNQNSEFFNEIDDERPMLFPGRENIGGPFPPPPGNDLNGAFGAGHGPETVVLGAIGEAHPQQQYGQRPVLVGPGGPTGTIGPTEPQQKQVLVGPDGPTGSIGPALNANQDSSASAQRGVLVGPGGPTGVIGPYSQRPILTGPGGPTGRIGPRWGGSRGVLVGPGGPTGMIGPGGYGRQSGPGLLVGPGGPTGIIGPGRQLLVGPGGPTGHIGPQRYYEKSHTSAEEIWPRLRREASRGFSHTRAPAPKAVRGRKRQPVPGRGCSRSDNSCGKAIEQKVAVPKKTGVRRSGGSISKPKHIPRRRVYDTRRFVGPPTPTTEPPPPTTTLKPSMFRFASNYVLLLYGFRFILALGILPV